MAASGPSQTRRRPQDPCPQRPRAAPARACAACAAAAPARTSAGGQPRGDGRAGTAAASGAWLTCGTQSTFGQARRARSASPGCWPGSPIASYVRICAGSGRQDRGAITRWVLLIHQAAPRAPFRGPELRKWQMSLLHVDLSWPPRQRLFTRPRPPVRRPELPVYRLAGVVAVRQHQGVAGHRAAGPCLPVVMPVTSRGLQPGGGTPARGGETVPASRLLITGRRRAAGRPG